MTTGIIIQARRSSTRLPDKIFKELPRNSGISVLGNVILRAKKACPNVIVATSNLPDDDKTQTEAEKYGAKVYRGSLEDVLGRYLGAAEKFGLDNIVRITADCPCVDPVIISAIIEKLIREKRDYVSNVEKRAFPHGLDTEAFTFSALQKANLNEEKPEIREHVTYHIRLTDDFNKTSFTDTFGLPHRPDIRITLDTAQDYTLLSALFTILPKDFLLKDIIEAYNKYTWLSEINNNVYQKKPFSSKEEELQEAINLLKLHNMENAVQIITEACAK